MKKSISTLFLVFTISFLLVACSSNHNVKKVDSQVLEGTVVSVKSSNEYNTKLSTGETVKVKSNISLSVGSEIVVKHYHDDYYFESIINNLTMDQWLDPSRIEYSENF